MSDALEGAERREELRREHDVELELESGFNRWLRGLLLRRGVFGVVVTVVTFLATATGFRLVGPGHDVQELRIDMARRDSALTIRAARLEEAKTQQTMRIDALESSVHFQIYLSCVLFRRIDPRGAPLECGPIIQSGPNP